ncbi:MAG: CPBP family intramembrane glutamic endopeptidase, partial [Candidatus Acidiferrales bacterium]
MRYIPHIVVLALIFVMPAWDYFESVRLKTSADPRKRVKWYTKLVVFSWLLTFLVIWAAGFRNVMTIGTRAAWMPAREGVRDLIVVLLAAVILIQVAAVLKLRTRPELREKIAKAMQPLYFMLPVTRAERIWFFFVSLTAGICEEAIYRGFLINYLMGAPTNLNVTLATVVSSLIFGMAHIYQGVRGAIGSSILGLIFALLFVMTGNLALPMLLHALIDARVLLMVSEGMDLAPRAG